MDAKISTMIVNKTKKPFLMNRNGFFNRMCISATFRLAQCSA
jgi:hypothetical protein